MDTFDVKTLTATTRFGWTYPVKVDDNIYEQLKDKNIRVDNWGYPCFTHECTDWTVAAFVLGKIKGYVIDHINGDPFDARRCNLRWASKSENALNSKGHRDNQSGYRGVSWSKTGRYYRARMKIGPNNLCKTHFKTPEEAATQINNWIEQYQVVAPLNVIKTSPI